MIRAISYLIYFGLGLPVLCIVAASLTAGDFISLPPQGLSFRWYGAFLADEELLRGLWISLVIAAGTTIGTAILGVTSALFLIKQDRISAAVGVLVLSPLNVPLVLTGFATLVFLTKLNLVDQTGLLIGHIVVGVPYTIRTILSSLSLSDPALPRAASILGANPVRTFYHVTFPLLRPGLVAGSLFSFLASLNNIALSVFVAAPGASPLPVVIFNRMDSIASPSIAAASSLLVLLTAFCVFVIESRFAIFSQGGSVR